MAATPWQPLAVMPGINSKEWLVASETIPDKWYTVFTQFTPPKCNCPDYPKHKDEPDYRCKHVSAYQEAMGGPKPEEGGMAVPPPATNGLSKWIVTIHGKETIRYQGLLAMAHEQGLVSFGARFTEITAELAVAWAWAHFKDGRKFIECGEATPNNVQAGVKAAWARMALTRAKARALRDALNIGMVSAEEIEE